MTQILSIRLLGGLSIIYNGEELKGLHAVRLQALLAYLLIHRHAPQSRQHLAFLFWPDSSETQAQTNLRQLLHTFRTRLPKAELFLEVTDRTVRWREDAPFTLDLVEFEHALFVADQLRGHLAINALESAVASYGGILLPACYDDWLQIERERLSQRYLNALEQLVLLLEQRRDYSRAIAYAESLLRSDPLHESTYRRLMMLHALNGERGKALRVYHTCVTLLERELGVTPSPATQEAYSRLFDLEHHLTPVNVAAVTTPLVGRHIEWQMLQDSWRRVLRGGIRCVCISGEPGIGKTRLAEDMLYWAQQQGITAVTTRAHAEGGKLAYSPLTELLRTEGLRSGISQMAPVWRTELARLLPELLAEDTKLPKPTPLTERWQLQRLYDAVAEVLMRAAQPLIILLDDLQWFDTETIAWLHYFLHVDKWTSKGERFTPRVLVLMLLRPEEVEEVQSVKHLLVDLRSADRLYDLTLGPLSAGDTAKLASYISDQPVDDTASEAIYHTSEGNPLFIVETIRMYQASDWDTVIGLNTQMPPKVQAVLQARLAQLSSQARELAGLAATIGRSFAFHVLAQASDQNEDELVQSLDELWRRRIVREQEADSYDFTHDSLRQVAYDELSPVRRRLAHRRLARALETVHAKNPAAVSAQLAHHYEQGGEYEPAIIYLRMASSHAIHIFAHQEAVALLNHALTLLAHLPSSAAVDELELELQMALCAAWASATDLLGDEVAIAYRRALELCRQMQHIPHLFTVLWGLHEVALYRNEFHQSLELAQQCLRIAEELGDTGLMLEAHHGAWGPYYFLGEYEQAFNHMVQGLALYDPASHESLSLDYGVHDAGGCALTLGALGLWNLGFIDQANDKMEAALSLAEKMTMQNNVADIYGHCGLISHVLRQPRQAETIAAKTLQISSETGSRFSRLLGELVLGWSLTMQGQVWPGIDLLEQAISACQQYGEFLHYSQFAAMLAEAYLASDMPQKAIQAVDEGIRQFYATRNLLCAPDLWTLKGDALQAVGALDDQIESCYQFAITLAQDLQARVSELRGAVGLARLRLRQGRSSEGYALLSKVYAGFNEGFDGIDLREAEQLLSKLGAER